MVVMIMLLTQVVNPQIVSAQDQLVQVVLPDFPVTLNGHSVENETRQYPLFLYKDITYFPLTWYDCRLMGLETKWSAENGLEIFRSHVTSSYASYEMNVRNKSTFKATNFELPITVGGEHMDQNSIGYPLLKYRDVTYVPMTWGLAYEAFGWEYSFNEESGLRMSSENIPVKKIDLPDYAGLNDVAYFEGYYYYVETQNEQNHIYRVSASGGVEPERLHSYDLGSNYGYENLLNFEVRNDALWFIYHIGGATMGSDIYKKIHSDGQVSLEFAGYLNFIETENGTLINYLYVPPSGNNLAFVTANDLNDSYNMENRIGDPGLIYGWYTHTEDGQNSYGHELSTTIIENQVYVIASPYPLEEGGLNQLYRINLDSGEMDRIVDADIAEFKIREAHIYYTKSTDRHLYMSDMNGKNEVQLSDVPLSEYGSKRWFDVMNGQAFYMIDGEEYETYLKRVDMNAEDPLVLVEPVEIILVTAEYLICQLKAEEDYGIKIINADGRTVLSITDQATRVFVEDGHILFIEPETNEVRQIRLLPADEMTE